MQAGNLAIDYENWDFQGAERDLFEHLVSTPFPRGGPQTDDELHAFIRIFLGFDIPRRPSGFCTGHVSPFSFIADLYFERVDNAFGFANRSGGKTRMVAILNLLEMVFKHGVSIVCAGAVYDQAQQGYRYLLEMFGNHPLLAQQLAAQPTMQRTFLRNGSFIQITCATYSGLNGPHPAKVRLDELELIHPTFLEEALSMAQSDPRGYKAQNTFTSTRKVSQGTVQKLLDEAKDRNVGVYNFCILENIQRCTRKCKGDPKHGDCPAYSKRNKDGKEEGVCGILDGRAEPHGMAQEVPPGGFYLIPDYIAKISVLDLQTFKRQWRNQKPSSGQLIYGEHFITEAPYVVYAAEARELLERAKYGKWMRVVGIDYGSNFSVGFWMQDPQNQTWYRYYEIFWGPEYNLSLRTRSIEIIKQDPLGWTKRTLVYGDPSAKQQLIDMQEGWPIGGEKRRREGQIDVQQANHDVMGGINHVKQLLEIKPHTNLPGLRVFSTCKRFIYEASDGYRHPIDKQGKILLDKILKENDHAMDETRYALYSLNSSYGVTEYSGRKLRTAGTDGGGHW